MFKWSDGATYKGEFLDNNIHGYGTYKCQMVESTQVSGGATKCMDKECSSGLMGDDMRAAILTIKKKDKVSLNGMINICLIV